MEVFLNVSLLNFDKFHYHPNACIILNLYSLVLYLPAFIIVMFLFFNCPIFGVATQRHVEDLKETPGSQPQSSSVPAVAAIWEVNISWKIFLCLCLTPLFLIMTFK